LTLPVAQYPEITPPSVQVSISYPGANAQVVADTVAAPVEQQVNGVPGMLYMSSQSGNDGSYTLTVTFDIGTNLNTALVMVQNRVTLALPQLPETVQFEGITIRKKTPDILQVVNLISPDGRYDDIYLSNYATINLKDELLRLEGVSDVNVFGQRDYSIRAWLDPQKMAALNITAPDVVQAIQTQNNAAAPGQIGVPPISSSQSFQWPLDTLGRLATPEEFGDIIIKVGQGGRLQQSAVGGMTAFPDTTGTNVTPDAGTPSSNPANLTRAALPSNGPTVLGLLGTGTTSTTNPFGGTTGVIIPGGAASSTYPVGTSPPSAGTTGGPSSGGTTGAGTANSGTVTPGASAAPNLAGLNGGGGAAPSPVDQFGGGTPGVTTAVWPMPPSPSVVRLRDVADVQMGASNYNNGCTFDRRPSVGLAVHQLPGSNALDAGNRVRAKMEELKSRFPEGLDYDIAYDTTPFIRESVLDVVYTLLEAVGLVALVVLIFLQNWRAALIPLIAVPVAIVGTFAVMAALRFSLNTISLFGLVLAIGIVVDDAIVVVENVERWLEQGLSPRDAARKAMDEVTGPVIAIALVLCAVFVPCMFIGGITGQFFRQFAVTIAVSTGFSAFNSLTLSPALAALLLRPRDQARDPVTWLLDHALGWLFKGFNWAFGATTAAYTAAVGRLLRVAVVVLLIYAGLLGLTYWEFNRVPTGFVPEQDKGYLLVNVQLPDSASVERTRKMMARIEDIARQTDGVAHTVGIAGQSLVLNANAPNLGSMYVMLKEFKERGRGQSADAVAAEIQRRCQKEVRGAVVTVFNAPPIEGLGTTGGFKLIVEDRGGLGLSELQRVSDAIAAEGNQTPGLEGLYNSSRSDTPWIYLDIDRTKCMALGVTLDEVFSALQIDVGSYYVNNFNEFGRTWQVNVQADQRFRERVRDLGQLQVRNSQGQTLPLGTVLTVRSVSGPVMVQRYNMYAAAAITGTTAPGTSTGEAVPRMQEVAARHLPRSMGYDWTELTFLQLQAGNTALYVFALAVVFVFLVLAAQYESWRLPLAVILVVPMCLLCSVVGVDLAGQDITIFVQIGFVVLVGLASKNAILIVEFAKQQQEKGVPLHQAATEASRLRLRPILMTSFAFILGVVPLVIATGAGAEMRRSLGIAVFSGMLGVTLFGIFLTPVFFYAIQYFGRGQEPQPPILELAAPDRPHGPAPAPETGIRVGGDGLHGH
jgi:multidrug efflux pump